MSDFPASRDPLLSISTFGPQALLGQALQAIGVTMNAASAWPVANRALYVPVLVSNFATIYQMSFEVGTQSGNVDVGIYDEAGNRLVSSGSTAVGATGLQAIDITDTTLPPSTYFLAMACDNGTATFMRSNLNIQYAMRPSGVQAQASAFPLPATATFAIAGHAFAPRVTAHRNPVV